MRDAIRGVYNYLLSDAYLRDMLGTFDGAPSIFTATPIPEQAGYPFAVINGSVSDVDAPTKNGSGRIVTCQTGVYAEANGDIDSVEEPAEYIRTVLGAVSRHSDSFVRGWRVVGSTPFGPIPNDLDGLYGRIITVEFSFYRP